MQPDFVSFSTKVENLQGANIKLQEDVEAWKEKANVESERLKLTEEQHRRFCESSEEQYRKICESNQQLQELVESYAASMEYLKNMLSKCFQGLGTALPVL